MAFNPLSKKRLSRLREEFEENPVNVLARNVCTKIDPFDACTSRKNAETTQHVFQYKVDSEVKPVTNQKTAGTCWIFAALNAIRIPFAKHCALDEFEFSQAHLFFWDKIERCHYWLTAVVEAARRGEDAESRTVSYVLQEPATDGGQWDMLVNLVDKHGLMPKKCYPETYSCDSSGRLGALLRSKLREFAKVLCDLVRDKADQEKIQQTVDDQMVVIYRIVSICLGTPPEKFTWEYYNKSKAYKSSGPMSPLEFYETLVKPVFNVDDKVCLVTDPRPKHPYGSLYTVDCLGNMVGGRPTLYNNQPVELLMNVAAESIKGGEAVWFGAEVQKRFDSKHGLQDLETHDFRSAFGEDFQITMSKADRVIYGESSMNHAMVFTGVSFDSDGAPSKFRTENSWGDEKGDKGYLLTTADWFKEFVFEVVADKKFVPAEVLQVFEREPISLPAWDPMGNLA